MDPLAWQLSRHELQRLMHEAGTVEDLFACTERYQGRGFYASIHAVQGVSEITRLVRLVQELRPKVIVEIGTFKGGTLFLWCRTNPQAEAIISIDLPGGTYGGGYDRHRTKLYREFLFDRPETQLTLVRGDSHEASTLRQLRSVLDGRPIDFLYIDADHTYTGVKRDYELYAPMVRRGGMIAFHDIETRRHGAEVYRFWEELRGSTPGFELVDPPGKYGIGVVFPR